MDETHDLTLLDIPAGPSQSESTKKNTSQPTKLLPKNGQEETTPNATQEDKTKWLTSEVLMLISCYEKYEDRFRSKREKTMTIWKDVSRL